MSGITDKDLPEKGPQATEVSDLEAEAQPASNEKDAPASEAATAAAASSPERKQPQLTDYTQRLPFAKLIAVYLCLATCLFVSFLDVNSTTTAIPVIGTALNATQTITWVGTAYLLAQCAFQVLYGRLADIFGRKVVLIVCILSLIVGDILCGFAQNGPWLYGSRAISGIGGGGISSLVQICVSDLVSLKERGKYQGILSGSLGLGAGIGPFIAAALIQNDPGRWRWAFWLPAVLAALCIPPLLILLPQKPVVGNWKTKVRNVDWIGLLTTVSGTLFILIPVNSGGSVMAWNSSLAIGLLTAGSVLVVIFIIVEWKFARLPMMPMRLFTSLSKATLFGQNFLFGFVWQADLYFLPIYYQDICGYSPIKSAYLTLPLLLAQSVAGVLSGPAMTLTARYMPVLWVGFVLWTLGAGLKLLYGRDTSVAVYVIVAIIEGAGVGFIFQPCLVALQSLSTKAELAVTTSTRNWVRALGSAVGVAVSTAVQYAIMTTSLPANLPPSISSAIKSGTWKAGDSPSWDDAILDAKMNGIHSVFIVFVPLMGFCLLSCIWVRDNILAGDNDKGEQKSNGRLISKFKFRKV